MRTFFFIAFICFLSTVSRETLALPRADHAAHFSAAYAATLSLSTLCKHHTEIERVSCGVLSFMAVQMLAVVKEGFDQPPNRFEKGDVKGNLLGGGAGLLFYVVEF